MTRRDSLSPLWIREGVAEGAPGVAELAYPADRRPGTPLALGPSDRWDSNAEQEEPEEGSPNRPTARNLPGKLVLREGPGRGGRRGGHSCIQPRWLPSQLSFASSSSSSCMSQAFPGDLEQPHAARAPRAVAAATAVTAFGAPAPGPPPRRAPGFRARTDHGEGGPGRRRRRGQQQQQPQQQPRHLGGLLALLLPGGPGGLQPVGGSRVRRRGQPQQPGLGGRQPVRGRRPQEGAGARGRSQQVHQPPPGLAEQVTCPPPARLPARRSVSVSVCARAIVPPASGCCLRTGALPASLLLSSWAAQDGARRDPTPELHHSGGEGSESPGSCAPHLQGLEWRAERAGPGPCLLAVSYPPEEGSRKEGRGGVL